MENSWEQGLSLQLCIIALMKERSCRVLVTGKRQETKGSKTRARSGSAPLAHFGATSDVCDGGVVRTDHHSAGERSGSTQHCDLKAHHASVGGW
jgi:hypothetical protein